MVVEHPRVAQDVEHGVGDARRVVQVEAVAVEDLVVDVDHVAQHREQLFLDAADHLAVDEGLAGAFRISSLMPQAWRTSLISKSL